jgi:hypothetical protein
VVSWVQHELEHRQGHLAQLMEHVRLPLLSQEYLVQRVEEEPLLKANLQCEWWRKPQRGEYQSFILIVTSTFLIFILNLKHNEELS